jgi:hypothetical protein
MPEPSTIAARTDAAGLRVVEMFGACAAAPDDLAVAAEADLALRQLEEHLADGPRDARAEG